MAILCAPHVHLSFLEALRRSPEQIHPLAIHPTRTSNGVEWKNNLSAEGKKVESSGLTTSAFLEATEEQQLKRTHVPITCAVSDFFYNLA